MNMTNKEIWIVTLTTYQENNDDKIENSSKELERRKT
jgi:hypothetical protein